MKQTGHTDRKRRVGYCYTSKCPYLSVLAVGKGAVCLKVKEMQRIR